MGENGRHPQMVRPLKTQSGVSAEFYRLIRRDARFGAGFGTFSGRATISTKKSIARPVQAPMYFPSEQHGSLFS